jgi:hypothetical protein
VLVALAACAALVLALSGCSAGPEVVEEYDVEGFDSIAFAGFGDLDIEQGDTESLAMRAAEAYLDIVEVEVRGDTLHIDVDPDFPWNLLPFAEAPRFELVVRDLTALELDGAASVTAGPLDADALELDLAGAGEIDFSDMTAEELTVDVAGAGDVEISGKVDQQEVSLSGAGRYAAGDLESDSCDVTLSGAGDATVWAEDKLSIELSGAGSIGYYGEPVVSQDVSGVGEVRSLGTR